MDCDNEEVQATNSLKRKKKNKCEFKKGDRIVCINEDNHEELKKGIGRALVDSLILEPNFNGIGFSFSKLINYLQNK